MNAKRYCIVIIITLLPVFLVDSFAEIACRIYRNPTIGFSLLVPTLWSTDEISTATLAVFSAYTKDAEIAVRVSISKHSCFGTSKKNESALLCKLLFRQAAARCDGEILQSG